MHIGIVEDEQNEANIAKEYLTRIIYEHYPNEKESLVIDMFNSAEDFLSKFTVKGYDLLLFDICLGEMNGMQAAKQIRKIDGEVDIVFLTGNSDFALEGYDVYAAGYFLKPLTEREKEFEKTFCRIFRKLKERHKLLKVSVKGVPFSIPVQNIFFMDIDWRHRLTLHLENEDLIHLPNLQNSRKRAYRRFQIFRVPLQNFSQYGKNSVDGKKRIYPHKQQKSPNKRAQEKRV